MAIALLPSKSGAPPTGPPGKDPQTEVFKKHVHPKSAVVSDKWTATPPAVKNAGSEMMASVNHVDYWRDPVTGIHSKTRNLSGRVLSSFCVANMVGLGAAIILIRRPRAKPYY